MRVKIYRPSKSATQSGLGRTHFWRLEAETPTPRTPDPLMGWTSSADTLNQIRLRFPTCEDAVAHATRMGWDYTILPAHNRKVSPRNYGDNFKSPPAGK